METRIVTLALIAVFATSMLGLRNQKALAAPNPDVAPEFGIVDINDIIFVANYFGTNATMGSPTFNATADINSDAVVDIFDLALVAISFTLTPP